MQLRVASCLQHTMSVGTEEYEVVFGADESALARKPANLAFSVAAEDCCRRGLLQHAAIIAGLTVSSICNKSGRIPNIETLEDKHAFARKYTLHCDTESSKESLTPA